MNHVTGLFSESSERVSCIVSNFLSCFAVVFYSGTLFAVLSALTHAVNGGVVLCLCGAAAAAAAVAGVLVVAGHGAGHPVEEAWF